MPTTPRPSGPRTTGGSWVANAAPCAGESPGTWQFRHRGCNRTRDSSRNIAWDRSLGFEMKAKSAGARSAPGSTAGKPASSPRTLGVVPSGPRAAEQPQIPPQTATHQSPAAPYRHRMAGNVAEVINLNLIEYPVLAPCEAGEAPGGVPPAVPGAQVGPGTTGTRAGAPSGATAGLPAPEGAPARVPVVPGRTVSPGLLPK